jgi:putative ABC transport system permease protein
LFVAGLGLFGLSTFIISQRIKEIAIRKVLGATIPGMIYLFSKDFIRLLVLANLVALPFVFTMAGKWLDGFAFHVSLGWLMFVLPAIILLLISLATVAVQTIKSGSGNPIDSLRVD